MERNPDAENRNSGFRLQVSRRRPVGYGRQAGLPRRSSSPCEEAKTGFTLVELLVTIGIIAILASILLPALTAAARKGEITRARMDMSQIVSAIKSYNREYGIWPVPTSNGYQDRTFGDRNNPQGAEYTMNVVMDILRAIPRAPGNVNGTNNVRKIVFLEIPPKSMEGTDKDGDTYKEDDGYYLDPWGNPYVITMDTEFDGEIGVCCLGGNAYTDIVNLSPSKDATFPDLGVGVMSYGPEPDKPGSLLYSWGAK
ncbi:MAG: type II secretion system GspH family protein [Candidatus Hydrogenedentes bacterium]|nr:type II secretion system GspH family protein [Candidatus Hydrogenedentota bacterium]